MTGYNAFIGVNHSRVRKGEALELFKPMGEERLLELEAVKGTKPGEIKCRFRLPVGSEDKHLTIITQKSENGVASGDLLIHHVGNGKPTQAVISGLEPGADYFVYGIVTDDVYDEAVTASEAVSDTAKAA